MNDIVKSYQDIHFNAFTLCPLIISFYKGCRIKGDNILLAYLIPPLLFNVEWQSKLKIIRSTSRLELWSTNKELHLQGIQDRFEFFKSVVTESLQYCFDMKWLSFDENNDIHVGRSKRWHALPVEDMMLKEAASLPKLFNGHTIAEIYVKLGIHQISL